MVRVVRTRARFKRNHRLQSLGCKPPIVVDVGARRIRIVAPRVYAAIFTARGLLPCLFVRQSLPGPISEVQSVFHPDAYYRLIRFCGGEAGRRDVPRRGAKSRIRRIRYFRAVDIERRKSNRPAILAE